MILQSNSNLLCIWNVPKYTIDGGLCDLCFLPDTENPQNQMGFESEVHGLSYLLFSKIIGYIGCY